METQVQAEELWPCARWAAVLEEFRWRALKRGYAGAELLADRGGLQGRLGFDRGRRGDQQGGRWTDGEQPTG